MVDPLENPAFRYRNARATAYREAERWLQSFNPDIRLTEIDAVALAAWGAVWKPSPNPTWPTRAPDWKDERAGYANTLDRFEVAIWCGDVLCGLAIGKPSKGREHLAVNLVEGSPAPGHPLKGLVATSMVAVAVAYAQGIGCKEVRLVKPLPKAQQIYEKLGFPLVQPRKGAPYCAVKV